MTTYEQERTWRQRQEDEKILDRVKAGLAWLEKTHGPGWEDKIDLETLDLHSGSHCVLGQVYREEQKVNPGMPGIDGYEYALFNLAEGDDFLELGFCAYHFGEWRVLQRLWTEELTPRVARTS